jgi:simple sugar transport system ATP-binding protein
MLNDVSLTVSKHEVISILGVAGNGQSELAEIIRGIRAPRAGTMDIAARTTGFVPEDRTRNALIADMTVAENISLGAPRWDARASARTAADIIATYGIKARGPQQIARELSGGNQQKVVLARELSRKPELIIAAEPTRGLDIDATAFVHRQLVDAVERGAGLLLITSDLDEAFALSDGVHVIYRGKLSARMTVAEAREKVATLMAGVA